MFSKLAHWSSPNIPYRKFISRFYDIDFSLPVGETTLEKITPCHVASYARGSGDQSTQALRPMPLYHWHTYIVLPGASDTATPRRSWLRRK
jgi:hypothetical protein